MSRYDFIFGYVRFVGGRSRSCQHSSGFGIRVGLGNPGITQFWITSGWVVIRPAILVLGTISSKASRLTADSPLQILLHDRGWHGPLPKSRLGGHSERLKRSNSSRLFASEFWPSGNASTVSKNALTGCVPSVRAANASASASIPGSRMM